MQVEVVPPQAPGMQAHASDRVARERQQSGFGRVGLAPPLAGGSRWGHRVARCRDCGLAVGDIHVVPELCQGVRGIGEVAREVRHRRDELRVVVFRNQGAQVLREFLQGAGSGESEATRRARGHGRHIGAERT